MGKEEEEGRGTFQNRKDAVSQKEMEKFTCGTRGFYLSGPLCFWDDEDGRRYVSLY
jgi:hypothetical protein